MFLSGVFSSVESFVANSAVCVKVLLMYKLLRLAVKIEMFVRVFFIKKIVKPLCYIALC